MELISSQENFDDFLKTRFVSGAFLQSAFWQDFLKLQNKNIWQLAVLENNQVVATCLLYEKKLPFGKSYLYTPKGPIFASQLTDNQKSEAMSLILSKVRDVTVKTKQYQEIFFKLEANSKSKILSELIKSPDIQPRDTWLLDIDKDHKTLLADMHPKTRYNISLAKRKGVKIKFSKNPEDIKYFLELISKTAKKNQIVVHSDKYYKLLWQVILKNKIGQLCLAEVDNKTVAANIVIYFGQAAIYVHGASDYNYRKFMAPHLLQWESIKDAMERGYKIYDWWGVAPDDSSKPAWQGFTRFKKSFGGRGIQTIGTHDFVFDKTSYKLYKLASRLKKIL
jgi:peptidoglycan pentaglycine glycine transferase (the first glycine)